MTYNRTRNAETQRRYASQAAKLVKFNNCNVVNLNNHQSPCLSCVNDIFDGPGMRMPTACMECRHNQTVVLVIEYIKAHGKLEGNKDVRNIEKGMNGRKNVDGRKALTADNTRKSHTQEHTHDNTTYANTPN